MAWTFYRSRNGGKLTEDMQTLKTLAKDFMPEDFIETCEAFETLCRKENKQ